MMWAYLLLLALKFKTLPSRRSNPHRLVRFIQSANLQIIPVDI